MFLLISTEVLCYIFVQCFYKGHSFHKRCGYNSFFFLKKGNIYLFIYLFIFGCVGSSFLCEGFL